MKKIILLFALLILTCSTSFALSKFYNLPYGDYHCIKNGETCDYEILEGTNGGHGKACPTEYYRTNYEKYQDNLADFLSSAYCKFTPSKIKKYACSYGTTYADVYLKDGKVVQVSGDIPKNSTMQSMYQPNKCIEVQMKHR